MPVPLIKSVLRDLYTLLYPEFCPGCNDALQIHERVICTSCRVKLPRTNFKPRTNNQVEKLFWGKVHIQAATAYLQFHRESAVKHLLYQLKYKGNQDVGEALGKMFASEYLNTGFFDDIDCIIPVPLHASKKRTRGYNQCDSICKGISSLSGIPVSYNALQRTRANATQTNKGRFERYANTKSLFELREKTVASKHVLLIDDVITTGSTLESCARPLVEAECKVNIACMAAPID